MSSPLQQQINEMEPRRYARAARKAAVLANDLALKAGTEVSERIRHLVDSTEDEIVAERTKELVSRRHNEPPPSQSGGGNVPGGRHIPTFSALGSERHLPPEKRSTETRSELPWMGGKGLGELLGNKPLTIDAMSGVTGTMSGIPGIWSGMPQLPDTSRVEPGLAGALSGILFAPGKFEPPEVGIGQTVRAGDQTWTAGRHADGDLFVSLRGQKPMTVELAQGDVVRVDTSRGLIAIVSNRPKEGVMQALARTGKFHLPEIDRIGHPDRGQLMVLLYVSQTPIAPGSEIASRAEIRFIGIGGGETDLGVVSPDARTGLVVYHKP